MRRDETKKDSKREKIVGGETVVTVRRDIPGEEWRKISRTRQRELSTLFIQFQTVQVVRSLAAAPKCDGRIIRLGCSN